MVLFITLFNFNRMFDHQKLSGINYHELLGLDYNSTLKLHCPVWKIWCLVYVDGGSSEVPSRGSQSDQVEPKTFCLVIVKLKKSSDWK